MITEEVIRTVLELPLEDRLELARRLVESVVSPADLADATLQTGREKGNGPRP